MNKYNLTYETNGKRVEKTNITQDEVNAFLSTLTKEEESSLRITQVKEEKEVER